MRSGARPECLADDIRVDQKRHYSKSATRPGVRSRPIVNSSPTSGEVRRKASKSAPVRAGSTVVSEARAARTRLVVARAGYASDGLHNADILGGYRDFNPAHPLSGSLCAVPNNPLPYSFRARLHRTVLIVGSVTRIWEGQEYRSSIGIAGETLSSPLPAPGWELLGLGEALQKNAAWNFIRPEPLQMRIGDLTVDQLKLPLMELLG